MHQLGRPNVGLENRGGPLGLGFNSSVVRLSIMPVSYREY